MTDLPPDLPKRTTPGADGNPARTGTRGYTPWLWLLGAVASVLIVAWGAAMLTPPGAGAAYSAMVGQADSAPAAEGGGDGNASEMPPEDLPPAPSTPVPAPGGGTIHEEAASGTDGSITVPLDQEVTVLRTDTGAVVTKIAKVEAIQAVATQAGETSGPAVAVTVEVRNSSDEPLKLSAVAVDLLDATEAPGQGIMGKPADWLKGELAPGASAHGVYVFRVDESQRDPVSVIVSLGGQTATAVFTGAVD